MFINQYRIDKDTFKEYAYKIVCRPFYIRGGLLDLFAIVMCIIGIMHGHYIIAAIEGIAALLLLISIIYSPYLVNAHLSTGEEVSIHFNEYIEVIKNNEKMSVEYRRIQKIIPLKNGIILSLGEGEIILVKRDAFVKGDYEQFETFIYNQVK
ncbi:hypothetical protein SAMN04487759_10828 [Kandleria vitulina]|uniref:YcxB-like C-terminal domain-containing protein n=1 Tax=Kandleria vitulina TaxID=1630 RepID=A0A1H2S4U5_9FIRM|nr:YcxB family protein [Kandleria vitulina]SDW26578.1 hypothetical protein SAMN04487759_10828 [Kandleria vitulina]